MSSYNLIVLVLGLTFLGAAALPRLLERTPLSLPMVYVALGMLLPTLWTGWPHADPIRHGVLTERLAELAVIISLMSAGLKLDRPLGWHSWRSTWRLLAITMPLCILLLALGGMWLMGLPLAAAVLLGAVIAPTDPVLASGVQVGPPGSGSEDEPRFALTSEAGLNDGLAFPFVNLAVVLAATGLAREGLMHWLALDVFWKILAGTGAGILIGRIMALVIFRFCKPSAVSDSFVAIALTLIAYGATEMLHGYGFIAVFMCALVFRRSERDHQYHAALHDFSEQIERLLMAVLLLLFGAAIAQGLFRPLTWQAVLAGLAFLLLVRPASAMLGLAGMQVPLPQRGAIALFGIRGIGTFYYLAHGLNKGAIEEPHARAIWAMAGFIVLASIVLHGTTASFVMQRIADKGQPP